MNEYTTNAFIEELEKIAANKSKTAIYFRNLLGGPARKVKQEIRKIEQLNKADLKRSRLRRFLRPSIKRSTYAKKRKLVKLRKATAKARAATAGVAAGAAGTTGLGYLAGRGTGKPYSYED